MAPKYNTETTETRRVDNRALEQLLSSFDSINGETDSSERLEHGRANTDKAWGPRRDLTGQWLMGVGRGPN